MPGGGRTEVSTLLLCCGADPTLVNCHSKTALDLAPTEDLRQRIECRWNLFIGERLGQVFSVDFSDEFKGHLLLEHAHKGDISKMKKLLSSKLANFQHPQTLDSPMVSGQTRTPSLVWSCTHPRICIPTVKCIIHFFTVGMGMFFICFVLFVCLIWKQLKGQVVYIPYVLFLFIII